MSTMLAFCNFVHTRALTQAPASMWRCNMASATRRCSCRSRHSCSPPALLQYGRLRPNGVILKTQKGRDSFAFIDFEEPAPAQVGCLWWHGLVAARGTLNCVYMSALCCKMHLSAALHVHSISSPLLEHAKPLCAKCAACMAHGMAGMAVVRLHQAGIVHLVSW